VRSSQSIDDASTRTPPRRSPGSASTVVEVSSAAREYLEEHRHAPSWPPRIAAATYRPVKHTGIEVIDPPELVDHFAGVVRGLAGQYLGP
jgi:hypothetical protein